MVGVDKGQGPGQEQCLVQEQGKGQFGADAE